MFGILLALQSQTPAPLAPPIPMTVHATLAPAAPVLDGRDDDAVWKTAPVIDQFLEARPSEGAQPKLRTEARVAYDAHNLYVFIRALIPIPTAS
jgi:hypothetical protein